MHLIAFQNGTRRYLIISGNLKVMPAIFMCHPHPTEVDFTILATTKHA